MKSVLEELYYGNIRPFATRRKDTLKTRELLNLVHKTRDQLYTTFTDTQKALFDHYESFWSDLTALAEKDVFTDGVRLGVQITVESLTE